MVDKLNTRKTALSLGLLFALMHSIGTLLISFTALPKAWTAMHFMNVNYTLLPFSMAAWLTGIVLAFAFGTVLGAVFSTIYNKIK